MRLTHFFIDRPIFAAVLSILVIIAGLVAYPGLPIGQYPEIAPPTVVVTATYPGANAETMADTVAGPLEEAINGVEGMIYMSSSATASGSLTITVSFKQGINIDQAQVLVQNRVATAEPRLPEEVRQMVAAGEVSTSAAMATLRKEGPAKGAEKLKAGVTKAKASGRTKATAKDIESKVKAKSDTAIIIDRRLAAQIVKALRDAEEDVLVEKLEAAIRE